MVDKNFVPVLDRIIMRSWWRIFRMFVLMQFLR